MEYIQAIVLGWFFNEYCLSMIWNCIPKNALNSPYLFALFIMSTLSCASNQYVQESFFLKIVYFSDSCIYVYQRRERIMVTKYSMSANNKEIFFSPKPGLWVGDGAKPNSIKYIEVTVYILDLYLMDIKL